MNFFEQELRKMFGSADVFDDVKYIGRACYGTLGSGVRVKLEFVTNGTHEQYEGIRATVLDMADGKLDAVTVLFEDALGKKVNRCGQECGPYAWTYNGKTEWYAYRPTRSDYDKITETFRDYAGLFREQTQKQSTGFFAQQQM